MTQLPSTQQLRYFVAVADQLNFRKAAEKCHVTQSTMSGAIQELESCLNVQLLERTKRKVSLTREGAAIAALARDTLERLEVMRALSESMRGPLVGRLRLGMIPTIAPFLLPEAIQPLRKGYPDLQLQVDEDLSPNLLDGVRQGRLDCAVLALPYPLEEIESKILFEDHLYVALPKGAGRKPKSMASAELAGKEMLLLHDGHCLKDQALAICNLAKEQTSDAFRAASLMTLLRMVEMGAGVTFVPEMAVDCFSHCLPGVWYVPLEEKEARRQICLCWRPGSYKQDDFLLLGEELSRLVPRPGRTR